MNTVEQQIRLVEFTLLSGCTVFINPMQVQAIYRGASNGFTSIVMNNDLVYEVALEARSVAKRLRGLA